MKKTDPLSQFLDVRKSLLRERADLVQRLEEIEKALAPNSSGSLAASGGVADAEPTRPLRKQTSRKRDQPPLKEIIRRLIQAKPLTRAEIVVGLRKARRPFTKGYLSVVLYTKGNFKRVNGKFAPAT